MPKPIPAPSTSAPPPAVLPAPGLRSAINLGLVIHLGLFALVLSTAWGTTAAQTRMLDAADPYLSAIHLHADAVPLTVPHASAVRGEIHFQWRSAPSETWRDWRPRPTTQIQRQRLMRYRGAMAEASRRDDTATVALLALPWVGQIMESSAPSLDQGQMGAEVRLVEIASLPDPTSNTERTSNTDRVPHRPPVQLWHGAVVPRTDVRTRRPTETMAAGGAGGPQWSLVTLGERRLNATGVPTE